MHSENKSVSRLKMSGRYKFHLLFFYRVFLEHLKVSKVLSTMSTSGFDSIHFLNWNVFVIPQNVTSQLTDILEGFWTVATFQNLFRCVVFDMISERNMCFRLMTTHTRILFAGIRGVRYTHLQSSLTHGLVNLDALRAFSWPPNLALWREL